MPAPSAATFARLAALIAIPDAADRPTRPVVEAFTGRELATVPVGTAADALAAIERARVAQKAWEKRSPVERAEVFLRYRDLVLEHKDALMDMAQAETGKSRASAQEEVLDIAMTSRYYARLAPKLLRPKRVQGMLPGLTKTVVRHHAKGVVGVISPWNYPMTLAVSDAIAALLAGNAVVIKPDSQTPYCALACAELLYQAGLPRELFAVVPGPGSVVGTALVENTDYLMFTGSTATGRLLAEQAGRRLIGFSAELGGKNPMIVAKGANLREVTDAAVRACFSNSGQLCISVERIYVEEAIAPEFIRQFGERVRNMTLAPGYEFGIEMGSLVSEDQVKTVSGHVDDAVAKGATVVAGGKARPDLGPLFYEPTVLTGSRPRWSATRTRRSGHWWRSTRSPTSRRPSRAPTTPTTGSTRAYGRAATPRARPSRPASWRAPSTSTRATAPPGAAPPPRWAAWGCRASAAATAPRVCSSTRRRRPSRPPGWSISVVRGGCRPRSGPSCCRPSSRP